MKNSLLSFALLIVLSMGASAQNFKFSPSQHLVGQLSGEWPEFTINIEPSSPEAIQYNWEIVENTLPMDWDMSLCDYNTCYALLPNSASMAPISLEDAKSGTKGFFKVTFLSYNTDTTARLSFYVYDSKDTARGDTVSFSFSTTSSVSSTDIHKIEVSPNPSSSVIHFDVPESNTNLRVIDFAGRTVLEETAVRLGRHSLNLSHLPKGVYFLDLSSSSRHAMSKLILQ